MTVSTTKASDVFPGNGVTTGFPCEWRIFDDTDVLVSLVDQTTGADTPLVLNTDYTISGAGDQAGFMVATLSPVATGTSLYVRRALPYKQPTDFTNQGAFFPTMHEDAMDRLEMQIQQQVDDLGRALKSSAVTGNYDVGGKRIMGAAAASEGTDVPTLDQVSQLIAGAASGLIPGSIATYTELASTASGKGAALLGFLQAGTGATARTALDKLRDSVSARDFGAAGDGVTDDTAALQACLVYCQHTGRAMRIPAGTYLTDTLSYGRPTGISQVIAIMGDGANDIDTSTTMQKKTADGLPIFTAGSTAGYTGAMHIQGVKFKGIAGNTSSCMQLTACDRAVIRDCVFMNAVHGADEFGGVSNSYKNCIFKSNTVGIYLRGAPAPSTSVASNNNTLDGCIIVDNSDSGVNFGDGSLLNIMNCDIEGNGYTGGAGRSGLFVDADVGLGVRVTGTWFESNSGTAAIYLKSGINTFDHCNVVANSSATYDLYVEGGTYRLHNVNFGTNKANNIFETAAVGSGNMLSGCVIAGGKTIDTAKTSVIDGTKHQMRGGNVPVVYSTTSPLIQYGQATCDASGVATVAFPKPYAAAPRVTATVIGSNAAIVPGVQVSSVGTSGFTIQTTYHNGTSVGTSAASVNWTAIGQG